MNWYKQIKFANKMIPVGNIGNHIVKAIQFINEGNWEAKITDKVPDYQDQKYIICNLTGTNIVMPNDWFNVKVYTYIKKAPNVVHPSEGSYGTTRGWDEPDMTPTVFEDTMETRRYYLNQMEPMNVSEYDSEKGHELIRFVVAIYGDINKQQGELDLDIIDIEDDLKTPYEIGQFVKTAINDFYFRGDDGDNDEPEDNPVPSTPGVKDREYSYV
jgi:hypothetical protein